MVKQARRLLTSPRAQAQLVKFHTDVAGDRHRVGAGEERERVPGLHIRCSPTTWRRRRTSSCARRCSRKAARSRRSAAVRSHLRERADGRVLRRAGPPGQRRRVGSRAAEHEPAGRPADAGVAAGDDGEGGSHRPGAPRKVRPRTRSCAGSVQSAVARDRRDVQAAGSEQDGARAVHRAPRPTRCARPATTRSIRSGCRSSTTTASGSGATTIAAWRSTPRADRLTTGPSTVRRRARRWRGCSPTCPTRAPATRRSGCASPKGKLNSDARQGVHRLADDAVHAQHARSSIWWRRWSAATRSVTSRRRTGAP